MCQTKNFNIGVEMNHRFENRHLQSYEHLENQPSVISFILLILPSVNPFANPFRTILNHGYVKIVLTLNNSYIPLFYKSLLFKWNYYIYSSPSSSSKDPLSSKTSASSSVGITFCSNFVSYFLLPLRRSIYLVASLCFSKARNVLGVK